MSYNSLMRKWTLKDKKRQACIARRDHPWKHSTGPRTRTGKNISKYNALKHGRSSKIYRELWRARRSYKKFIPKFLPLLPEKDLRKHIIYEFELLSIIANFTFPEARQVKFCKDSLQKWLQKVTNETIYAYNCLLLNNQ